MHYRDLLCESTDLSLTLADRDVHSHFYDDGEANGQYMFEIAEHGKPLVYVVVGVNIMQDDERTGLEGRRTTGTRHKFKTNPHVKFDMSRATT